MRIPDRNQAEQWLQEAGVLNPGPWVAHSRYVAEAARSITARLPTLDAETSYVLGILHDIGRRAGVTGMRHVLDGYNFLIAAGSEAAARISLTHSLSSPISRNAWVVPCTVCCRAWLKTRLASRSLNSGLHLLRPDTSSSLFSQG